MRQNMGKALQLIFGHEGGYVNAKTDRGGPTKFGVTQKTLSNWRGHAATIDDVKDLKLEEASVIMEQQYAKPIRFDELPSGLDYAVLDYAINSGPSQAAKTLQKALDIVPQDGIIGVNTLAACRKADITILIKRYCDERMRFLRSLGGAQGFRANGRGWTIRVTGKDPKGEWKEQPGVYGNAMALATKQPTSALMAPPEAAEPARSNQQTVASTTQGKGAIVSVIGLLSSQVDSAKATIEPYVGSSQYITYAFTGITFLGLGIGITGALMTAWGIYKRIQTGTPR